MPVAPHTVALDHSVFRVARGDAPMRFSVIDPADVAVPNGGNRYDVPGGGVLYCATTAAGCYAETLARFRPSAAVRAAVQHEDPAFMMCGGVPADWRARRLKIVVEALTPLPFLDVEHPDTHDFLTTALAQEIAQLVPSLSNGSIDVPTIRGANRLLTRMVASWAFAATDDDGAPLYSGIRYVSRLGDHECWAIFEGTEVIELARHPIARSDPDLRTVAQGWDLNVF